MGLRSGNLLRFSIGDGGLSTVDGKLEKADLHYLGKSNRARAFADSYSKVCKLDVHVYISQWILMLNHRDKCMLYVIFKSCSN